MAAVQGARSRQGAGQDDFRQRFEIAEWVFVHTAEPKFWGRGALGDSNLTIRDGS